MLKRAHGGITVARRSNIKKKLHLRSKLVVFIVTAVGLLLVPLVLLLYGEGTNTISNDAYYQVLERGAPVQVFDSTFTKKHPSIGEEGASSIIEEEKEMRKLPTDWKSHLYVHILNSPIAVQFREKGEMNGCGGCMVLWELEDSLKEFGIAAISGSWDTCPTEQGLAHPISENQVIVFVYPEGLSIKCHGIGNRVHARWILAPLHSYQNPKLVYNFRNWGEDDLVFNYASSTAVHPNLLPSTNIMQVMRNPRPGDGLFDASHIEPSSDFPPRQGTLVVYHKAERWHTRGVRELHRNLPKPHQVLQKGMNFKDESLHFKFVVSYDPYTFYSYSAAMLGAISIVYPLENMSKKTWAEGTYVGEYLKAMNLSNVPGVAYGFKKKEIDFAYQTKGVLRSFLMNARAWGKNVTLDRFARDCYRHSRGERNTFESGLLVRDAYIKWYDSNNNLLQSENMEMTY